MGGVEEHFCSLTPCIPRRKWGRRAWPSPAPPSPAGADAGFVRRCGRSRTTRLSTSGASVRLPPPPPTHASAHTPLGTKALRGPAPRAPGGEVGWGGGCPTPHEDAVLRPDSISCELRTKASWRSRPRSASPRTLQKTCAPAEPPGGGASPARFLRDLTESLVLFKTLLLSVSRAPLMCRVTRPPPPMPPVLIGHASSHPPY